MWIVYEHKNKINGKRYFGITCKSLNIRCGKNGCRYFHNDHFSKAIEKYGWENFEHNIILKDVTKEEACYAEIYLIKWYDTTNPKKGYNQSTGGELSSLGIHKPNKHKGEKRNVAIGKKISDTKLGHPGYTAGMKMTEEAKEKISEAIKRQHEIEKENGITGKRNKKVMQISTGKIYNSLREAGKAIGHDHRYISNQIKKYKDCDWKYIEEETKPE